MQQQTQSSTLSLWLFLCLLVTIILMVVHGTAELRESGISITQVKPLGDNGFPASDEEFAKEFESYKSLPQFQRFFPDMPIEEFKVVYLLEYIQYILIYCLVILLLLPLALFYAVQVISGVDALKLAGIFAFGGVQYIAHYHMEQNAMMDDPHFIPYRLSLQLALQFMFLGLLLWRFLSFSYPRQDAGGFELPKPTILFKVFACLTLAAIFLQITLGGAVSGLNAGLIFNTFPYMEGVWLPDGVWGNPVWYKNLFEDATTAQFVHRILTYGLALLIPLFWLVGNNNPHIAHLLPILFSIFVVQFLLGVLTLLFTVPLPLAALHLANAILIFMIAVTIMHRLFIPVKTISYDIGTL